MATLGYPRGYRIHPKPRCCMEQQIESDVVFSHVAVVRIQAVLRTIACLDAQPAVVGPELSLATEPVRTPHQCEQDDGTTTTHSNS
jgi:hypothetical protein